MKSKNFNLIRYDADEGKVFDWVEPRPIVEPVDKENPNPDETHIVGYNHLYAKTIFVGGNDSIENYIEIDEPIKEGENN